MVSAQLAIVVPELGEEFVDQSAVGGHKGAQLLVGASFVNPTEQPIFSEPLELRGSHHRAGSGQWVGRYPHGKLR